MNAATSIGVVAYYNLLERLEPAGPGDLYRARDTRHGRTVVVRLLPSSETSGSEQALLQQAASLTRLSHPNAVTLYASGQHEERPFLAFEYVTGRSLRAEMAGRQMNPRRAVELAIEIADAVAEAHALGYLHGGLSPDAIGVTAKGHAKIAAFHLATTLGFASAADGLQLADYGSPEEARGDAADERSDVYSIGAILYEMLAARRPMHRGASAPSSSNSRVIAPLDSIVLTAVAPNAERRYQTVAELAAALRGVASSLELPDGEADLGERTTGTSLGRVAATSVLILAVLGLIAWFVMRR
jgi:serine/threonine-protein kinase